MIRFDEWNLPDGEQHLQQWMTKVNLRIDGRLSYQYSKLEKALSFCKQFRNAVDIGAHCGLISFHLVKKFQHTYAFEPVKEHRECFMKNVEGSYTLFASALGANNDYCSMQTTNGSSGDTHVIVDHAGGIQMHPLDEFGLNDVDFIKIDVEGFEQEIIKGALRTIQRDHPVIMVECKGHEAKHFGFEKLGAVKLLESIGMKQLCPPMSGDYFLGW